MKKPLNLRRPTNYVAPPEHHSKTEPPSDSETRRFSPDVHQAAAWLRSEMIRSRTELRRPTPRASRLTGYDIVCMLHEVIPGNEFFHAGHVYYKTSNGEILDMNAGADHVPLPNIAVRVRSYDHYDRARKPARIRGAIEKLGAWISDHPMAIGTVILITFLIAPYYLSKYLNSHGM